METRKAAVKAETWRVSRINIQFAVAATIQKRKRWVSTPNTIPTASPPPICQLLMSSMGDNNTLSLANG